MATEKRFIDALPLMKNGWHLVQTGESNRFLASMSLADVPRVDAVEVVHGHWEYEGNPDDDGNIQAYCSVCGAGDQHADCMVGQVPYCWKCGAKMDGERRTDNDRCKCY